MVAMNGKRKASTVATQNLGPMNDAFIRERDIRQPSATATTQSRCTRKLRAKSFHGCIYLVNSARGIRVLQRLILTCQYTRRNCTALSHWHTASSIPDQQRVNAPNTELRSGNS
jgi:hypothetical protein